MLAILLLPAAARAAVLVPPPATEPDRTVTVPNAPERPFAFPRPRRERTANGIAVTATELKSLPIVAIEMVIPAASAVRASLMFPAAEGLASLTAELLDENTAVRDGEAFSRAMENLGASFSISAGGDALFLTLFAKKANIDAALSLAAEALLRPSFRDADLERAKRQTLVSLQQIAASPTGVAGRRLSERIYGDHPYGTKATAESIAAVGDAQRLTLYHAMAYQPQDASIHAAGDLSVDELKALAEKYFASWPSPPLNTAALRAIPQIPTPDVRAAAVNPGIIELIDVPGAPQSVIKVGQTAVKADHPDFYALKVLAIVLGGPDGRINDILREQKHWAYGASASFSSARDGGSLVLSAPVQTSKTAESLAVLLGEMKRLQDEDVTAEELEKVKQLVIASSIDRLETVQSIAQSRAVAQLYGMGDDSITKNRDAFISVTAADVRRVAKRYLRPNEAAIVVAGDAAVVRAGLEKIAAVRLIDGDGKPVVETAAAP
jgi:zinc protease